MELVKNANFQSPSSTLLIEWLETGLGNLHFSKHPERSEVCGRRNTLWNTALVNMQNLQTFA